MNSCRGDRGPDPDLACGACGYQLRGLGGPVVRCPECGLLCDLAARLASRRADWLTNDEYVLLARPSILAQVTLVPAGMLAVLTAAGGAPTAGWVPVTLFLIAWAATVRSTLRRAPGWEAASLMLGIHVVLLGYLVSMVAAIAGFVALLASVAGLALGETAGAWLFMGGAAVCPLGVGAILALQRLDRAIGARCIHRWLERAGAPAPGATLRA